MANEIGYEMLLLCVDEVNMLYGNKEFFAGLYAADYKIMLAASHNMYENSPDSRMFNQHAHYFDKSFNKLSEAKFLRADIDPIDHTAKHKVR